MADAPAAGRFPVFLSGTLPGILAILLWSTVVAGSRQLSEQLGTFTSGALIFLTGGALSLAPLLLRRRGPGWLRRYPRRYLWGCGGLFVFYEVCFYLAVGYAGDRRQVLEVGLINYLWIAFTLLFAVPILKKRAGPLLPAGIAAALAGVALAVLPPGYAFSALPARLLTHGGPYLGALACAVAWGLYSNLSRKWAGDTPAAAGAVPLFLLATGLALLAIRLFVSEESRWSPALLGEALYMALLPITLGYIFWDMAMRRGRLVLVAALAFLIPLLSTLVSGFWLGVAVPGRLWLAGLLIIGGAALCRLALRE